ncbi:MAG: thioredoxin family protein [Acidobacteriota bacterium]
MTRITRCALLVSVGLSISSAFAGEPMTMILSGRYQLRVGDALDKSAKIYRSEKLAQVLVVSSALSNPVLIGGGAKTAKLLDPTALKPVEGDSDSVVFDPDQTVGAPIATIVDGGNLRFAVGTTRAAIEPADPLLGDLSVETVLGALPEWRRNIVHYKPGIGDIRLLDTIETPTEVEVFFGSWCPHCEKYVPRLLSVVAALKGKNLTFRFHGVPHKFDDDPEVRLNKVTGLPTGLVRQGGKVVARIEEISWEQPEGALSAVLFGEASVAPGSGSGS